MAREREREKERERGRERETARPLVRVGERKYGQPASTRGRALPGEHDRVGQPPVSGSTV